MSPFLFLPQDPAGAGIHVQLEQAATGLKQLDFIVPEPILIFKLHRRHLPRVQLVHPRHDHWQRQDFPGLQGCPRTVMVVIITRHTGHG